MTVPIDFVHAGELPWRDGAALSTGRAPQAKVLRSGPAGSVTAVVHLPPDGRWTSVPGHVVSFLVLGGRVEVAGQVHGHLGFGQLRSDDATTWVAQNGARLLVFQAPGDGELAAAVDTLEADWQVAEDPVAGIWRELTLAPAGNTAGAIALRSLALADATLATHRHDWDEEVFVVDGERLTPAGSMSTGAYAWRPRGLWHGGFRTGSAGALMLVRRIADAQTLAGAAELSPYPVSAQPIRREARLAPADVSTTTLLRQRTALTGQWE